MSVNSKMKVIADKIRSLLGITGTMGLDAIATNLETEKTNVTNAFTAVGNKGGTVPTSRVSGNLATAISSIPDGVTVQRTKTDSSFTPSGGSATVNCGFKPDLVVIKNGTNNSRTQTLSFPFYEVGASTTIRSISEYTGNDDYAEYILSCQADCKLTSSGFQISGFTKFYYTGDESDYDEEVYYIAIKYT